MLFIEDTKLLMENRQKYSYKEFLLKYVRITNDVLYQHPNSILDYTQWLKQSINQYARENSLIYRSRPWNKIIEKKDLILDSWQVPNIDCFESSTSGTTNDRFQYRIWSEIYDSIEQNSHYKLIVDEFFNNYENLNILYCMLDKTIDKTSDVFTTVYQTNNILMSHGLREKATIHEVIANKMYFHDYYQFYHDLLFYATDHKIDIILAPANVITALTWNAVRLNYNRPICKLLSNTGVKLNLSDPIKLLSLGCIEDWCDHMRCWDGGASFFTCQYRTYHLMDNLAWVRSDSKNRLISDDYFSLPNPFVNYWNGDYIQVSGDYNQCRCGRYYREFIMGRTKDVYVNNFSNDYIDKESDKFPDIKRIDEIGNFMRIFTTRSFSMNERSEIRSLLNSYSINFIVEN